MINNFDAGWRLLNHGDKSLDIKYPRFRDKLDLFFIDHEWVPLLVQDGYLNSFGRDRNSLRDLEVMADASESISFGDELNRKLRTTMNWSLLPDVGLASSVAPCLLIRGKSFYPGFPQWLGKNSSARKSLRQIRELKAVMGTNAQASRKAI